MTSASQHPSEPERLLGELDPQQRRVAMQVAGPLCVRAGAGTGKTRAITYRIAYGAATGAVDPSTVLAVTFTAKAAAEMGGRLRALGAGTAAAKTFHSAALAQLSYFWPSVYGGAVPQLAAHKASLVAAAASRVGVRTDKTLIRDLSSEIEWSKVSMLSAARYSAAAQRQGRGAPGGLDFETVAKLIDSYEAAKQERGVIDFEDVLLLTGAMIASREDVANRVRSRYRSFVVDEYQDVSPVQQRLLDLWVGDRRDLCVVGDVAQTIYSFTGATPHYLESFPARIRGANIVELVRDYRSTPQVVAVANQVVDSARGMDGAAHTTGIPGSVRLVAQQADGPAVNFTAYESDDDEAAGVAKRIRDLAAKGVGFGDIAVLYRTNSQSEAFERALQDAGVGFQVHGGARFFEREEVRRALMLLAQQSRSAQLAGISTEPVAQMVRQVAVSLGWTPKAPVSAGAQRERWSNLDALVQMASDSPELSLADFVEDLRGRAESKAAPSVDAVTLTTLHAAKGLEWEAVFLVGACEGLLPISLADGPAAVEEERRLFYVGVTRAKRHLNISYATSRAGNRGRRRSMSRFLKGIWPTEPTVGRRVSSASKRKEQQKEFREEADPQTLALLEELLQWRRAVARERDCPVFTVLTEATLRDVATAKPRTLKQLGVLRGIGSVKLSEFGGDVLRIVRDSSERR